MSLAVTPLVVSTFQSTLPVWGATLSLQFLFRRCPISIHAPRVGSDCDFMILTPRQTNFNPRSPCGERLPRSMGILPV